MTDVISFETTKKLLEAGFPKSDDWGLHYWIVDEPETKRTFKHSIGGSYVGNGDGLTRTIRASSALDILKKLGTGYVIEFLSDFRCWYCYKKANPFEYKTFGASSAEAAAEMYLNVNS
jgi:hypothetical protein